MRASVVTVAVALAFAISLPGCGSTTTTTYLQCAAGPVAAAAMGGKAAANAKITIGPKQRPQSCAVMGTLPRALALAKLRRLRWTDWGSETAQALGMIAYGKLEPVDVTAFRQKTCGERVFYSKMTIEWKSRPRSWELTMRPCLAKDT